MRKVKDDAWLLPYKKVYAEVRRLGGTRVRQHDWRAGFEAYHEVLRLLGELKAEMKGGERVETLPVLIKLFTAPMLLLVEDVQVGRLILATFDQMTRDPDLLAALTELDPMIRDYGDDIEQARSLLAEAKDTIDQARTLIGRVGRDADAAEEAWSTAAAEVEGRHQQVQREAKLLKAWYDQVMAATDARTLQELRAARPATPGLQIVAEMKRDTPIAQWQREYQLAALPKPLQDEVRRDLKRLAPLWVSVQASALAAALLDKEVAARRIEPPDAKKGLKVLGLEARLLPRLKAALEQPAALREKALEALARSFKLPQSGRQMLLALQKARVV